MIVYGLTMQGKKDEVPIEVAKWLLERDSLYYDTIEFKVDVQEVRPEDAAQTEPILQKYSRLFSHTHGMSGGILSVTFPYRTEMWYVKIIGGANADGTLADRTTETIKSLSAAQRAEIAGWNESAEQVNEKVTGFVRQQNDPLKDHPTDMVALPVDLRWTSEVSMTGAELGEMLSDPQTREQAGQAIWHKDWQKLKHLRDQNRQA